LGHQPEQDFARIDRRIAEAPIQDLGSDRCLHLDLACCLTVPPTNFPTRDGLALATLASLLGKRFALNSDGLGHAVVSDSFGFGMMRPRC
jgi:hypothetical protein